jgi:hypothetical protein
MRFESSSSAITPLVSVFRRPGDSNNILKISRNPPPLSAVGIADPATLLVRFGPKAIVNLLLVQETAVPYARRTSLFSLCAS